jgi:6-phosphogluconolactonase (cycloisomerase 2 family)
MRTRFTWIVASLALVSLGLVMACNTKYSSSSNGLVVVPSQGSVVMETFSLDLTNGHISQINNINGPSTNGVPTGLVLDPAGDFAYVITYQNAAVTNSSTGIISYQIAPDGKLATGTTLTLANESYPVVTNGPFESVPVVPVALTIDSAGKFIFVADSATVDGSGNQIPGAVSILSVGSNGSLTEIPNSPFVLPVGSSSSPPTPCTSLASCPSASAVAVTPTIYPIQFATCSLQTAPSTENLYVTDSVNYLLLNYSVDPSAGTLTLMPYSNTSPGIATGSVPSGVAVDACNRFAYVSNELTNSVSAYTVCSAVNVNSQPPCLVGDFSLHSVVGSPFPAGNSPGPITADAFGNFVYVVDRGSNEISGFRISPATGGLVALTPATVVTNQGPTAIAIRGDDSFMFVSNITSANISQYAITPATGALTPQASIVTYNLPSAVAVK